jgi:hypothetical protein
MDEWLLTTRLVACILLLLLRDAARLLDSICCISSRRVLLAVCSTFSSTATTADISTFCSLASWLVSHLMVVHSHQLIDKVTELS